MARTKHKARRALGHAKNIELSKDDKRPHRWRPGTDAIRKIKKYQQSQDLLMRKGPFSRLVREIASGLELQGGPVRFQRGAFAAAQYASEEFLRNMFEDAQDYALHAGRETVTVDDINMWKFKRLETPQERNLSSWQKLFRRPRKGTPKRRHKSSTQVIVAVKKAQPENTEEHSESDA